MTTTFNTPDELRNFVAEVFASLVRTDQSATSSFYLQGRRKSMQPMAQRLGIDQQAPPTVLLLLTLAGRTREKNPGHQG